MQRRIMLTVDAEALPRRAKDNHVDRLIWGKADGKELGVGRMMDIAERRGAPLTVYLEFAEHRLYGDDLLEAGRRIHARGHDLQLHLHQHVLDHKWHKLRGLAKPDHLDEIDERTADAYLDYICPLHAEITGEAAVAYRGGAYRYNGAMLRSLKRHGVSIASNYNLASKADQILDIGPVKQFVWDNGVLEVPVSTLPQFYSSGPMHLNFNIGAFLDGPPSQAAERTREFLQKFYKAHGDDAIAVLVMHSWSFLKEDGDGCFSVPLKDAPERFDAMLEALQAEAQVVTARDVAHLASDQRLTVSRVVGLPEGGDAPVKVEEVLSAATLYAPRCQVCDTPAAEFKDYNGPKRCCPGCGSVERQRVLSKVYDDFIRAEHSFAKGETLIVAPMQAEKLFLKRAGAKTFKTMDVRPDLKPDFQVDVCDMPQVPSASFDAIIASFVLTCVYDMDAALAEFHRVLKPGGRLFTTDPIRFGQRTNEITEVERITSWYGKENYEKYRVGNYRNLGDLDLIAALQKRFVVKTFYGVDEGSGLKVVWHMSTKTEGGLEPAPVRPAPKPRGWADAVKAKLSEIAPVRKRA